MSAQPKNAGKIGRIVVADEDPGRQALTVSTLRAAGHAVFRAANGVAAYQLCFALRAVDLLITSGKLPQLQGSKLIRTVRRELGSVPILCILNSVADPPPVGTPPDLAILASPFSPTDLLDIVNRILGG